MFQLTCSLYDLCQNLRYTIKYGPLELSNVGASCMATCRVQHTAGSDSTASKNKIPSGRTYSHEVHCVLGSVEGSPRREKE